MTAWAELLSGLGTAATAYAILGVSVWIAILLDGGR